MLTPDVDLYLPASHSSHAGLTPDVALYFPASHILHGPPLGPVYPSLHLQKLTPLAPAINVLPFTQSMQASLTQRTLRSATAPDSRWTAALTSLAIWI